MKLIYCLSIDIERIFVPIGVQLTMGNIGVDDDLKPYRLKAFICTNDKFTDKYMRHQG